VLLLAYMFPPIVDGGAFRPASFARYLPEFGYEPIVLTRPDSGDLPIDHAQLDTLPSAVRIERVPKGFAEGWNDRFRRRLAWTRGCERLRGRPAGGIAEAMAGRAAGRDHVRRWEGVGREPATEKRMAIADRNRPAVIVASGPPFESLKAGWTVSQRTGIP